VLLFSKDQSLLSTVHTAENSQEKDEQTDLQDSNYLFTNIIGGILSSTEDMVYKTLETAITVTKL
jgi:hypothetical protein